MKRQVLIFAIIAAVVLAVALPVSAGDEFNTAVDRISQRIGRRPMHIPFLGAILFFTPAHSAHLKVATFEDVHSGLTLHDLESSMGGVLGVEWHPFVKVDSRRDHECTLIYARAEGSAMRLMVITAETNEVTVVQLDVPKKLQGSWLDHTEKMAHHASHGDIEGDGDGA